MRGRTRPVGLMRRGGRSGSASNGIIFNADFTALSAGPAASLPSGFSFSRASSGYSVRTGDSSLSTATFGADVARVGREATADDLGVYVEDACTQLMNRSEDLGNTSPAGSAWTTAFATITAGAADGPDGSSSTADRVQSTSGSLGDLYDYFPNLTDHTYYTFSTWLKGLAGGESYQVAWGSTNLLAGRAVGGTLTTSWQRAEVPVQAGDQTATVLTNCRADVAHPKAGNAGSMTGGIAAGNRDEVVWGCMFHAGRFARSYIPTTNDQPKTRAGERLYHSTASRFVRSGRLKLEIRCRPIGASSGYEANVCLWKCGTDTAVWSYSTGLVTFTVGGVAYTTPVAVSWTAGQSLWFYSEVGGGVETYAAYSVDSGASRTLLTLGTPPALGAVDTSGALDIGCNGTSNQIVGSVQRVIAYA